MIIFSAVTVGIATLVTIPCVQGAIAKRNHHEFNTKVDMVIGKNI